MNADDKNHVELDISVICASDKLSGKGCIGAPDWIIEVVSSGSRRMNHMVKLFKYRTVSVCEYWIVDPDKNRVMIYNFSSDDMSEYAFRDEITSGIYPGFFICIVLLDI